MKLSFAAIFLVTSAFAADAFAPANSCKASSSSLNGAMSEDVGIPCEEECAVEKYPNLPDSVHPGVLSGKAMMDLLRHAKENGTCRSV
jgi:fructose-bisphosphate aldolase class II